MKQVDREVVSAMIEAVERARERRDRDYARYAPYPLSFGRCSLCGGSVSEAVVETDPVLYRKRTVLQCSTCKAEGTLEVTMTERRKTKREAGG